MLADRIDLTDIGAWTEQGLSDRFFVLEWNAIGRRNPVGRCAAWNKNQHEVIMLRFVGELQRDSGCLDSDGVWDWMTRLQHSNVTKAASVAPPCHRDAAETLSRQRDMV